MGKYIQDKNGKFVGSIGDGKTNVPSSGSGIPVLSEPEVEAKADVQALADTALRRLSAQARNPQQRRQHEWMLAVRIANLPSTSSVQAAFLRHAVHRAESAETFHDFASAQLDIVDGVTGSLFPGVAEVRFARIPEISTVGIVDIRDSQGRSLLVGDGAYRRAEVVGSVLGSFPYEAVADYFPAVSADAGSVFVRKVV